MLTCAGAEGDLDLETLACEFDGAVLDRLLLVRGVGRWTAEYVRLRGLERLHVSPGDNVGASNNFLRWLGLAGPFGSRRGSLGRPVLGPRNSDGGPSDFH